VYFKVALHELGDGSGDLQKVITSIVTDATKELSPTRRPQRLAKLAGPTRYRRNCLTDSTVLSRANESLVACARWVTASKWASRLAVPQGPER
jgi:hypothetical protein